MTSRLLDDYMTTEELADELGKSVLTVAKWRNQKIGPPYIRVGKKVLYGREGVRKWLNRLEQHPQFSAG